MTHEYLINLIAQAVLIIIQPLLVAIAGLLVAVLVRKLRKLGLDITDAEQQQLKVTAIEAVKTLEEQARRAQRDPLQPNMTQDEKHVAAAALVSQQMPALSLARVSQAIDAALPQVRAVLGSQEGVNAARLLDGKPQ